MRVAAVPLALVAACTRSHDVTTTCTVVADSGRGVLADFCAPDDPGANAILISASGERLAIDGYRFPPVTPGDFALVDGWDITYANVITTIANVTLSDRPLASCFDQSIDGSAVAAAAGPWAIDLHAGGALVGKAGPPEQAAPIAALVGENLNGNGAFDPSATYAFSFDIIPAAAAAQNVNLGAAELPLYEDMIARGCTTLLVGRAVWRGTSCTQTAVTPAYDFAVLPTTIDFHLCLPAPASYVNAQNPELDPARPCAGEEHARGVHTVQNQPTVVQATLHLDHVLWESFVHDSPSHFDPYAARVAGQASPATVTLDDLTGASIAPFVDALGHPVPWRDCVGASYTPPSTGAMTFDTQGRTIDPIGTCVVGNCNVIRDFRDYVLFAHSTAGHLNANGLAFVQRGFAAPN